jgi:hypothetical protein
LICDPAIPRAILAPAAGHPSGVTTVAAISGDVQIHRNQTFYVNSVWDVSKSIQVSAEANYRETNYLALPDADGVIFLTQFLWRL